MNEKVFDAIRRRVQSEPFAKKIGLELEAIEEGYSLVKMKFTSEMENIFGNGTVAVALNVNITYHASPSPGDTLIAEAKEVNKTNRTGNYYITVKNQDGKLIASCQALAYRKKDRLPFLDEKG